MWNHKLFNSFKMNFSLCSTPSEITSPCLESSHSINMNKLPPLSSIRASDFTNKESIQVSSRDARKMVLSCQYVPGQLEGTRLMGKPLSKPRQKLEFVRTLLIDNYDSYTYNIYQELSVVNGRKLSLYPLACVCICAYVPF